MLAATVLVSGFHLFPPVLISNRQIEMNQFQTCPGGCFKESMSKNVMHKWTNPVLLSLNNKESSCCAIANSWYLLMGSIANMIQALGNEVQQIMGDAHICASACMLK